MKASLVVIGTEITRGLVQDTHTKNLTFLLSTVGIETDSVFIIPDSKFIQKYLLLAIEESDIVITTGGLGPTNDDMTRFEISKAFNIPLVENLVALEHIKKLTSQENISDSNRLQALIPKDFLLIDNKKGTALGFYGKANNKLIISLPGPPFEQNPMHKDLKKILENYVKVDSKDVYTYTLFVVTEADFNELTNRVLSNLSYTDDDIIVGTCYKEFRVIIYIYTHDKSKADNFVAQIKNELKNPYGLEYFQDGDVDIFEKLADTLLDKKLTIATAESITGGLVAKKFTDMAGSSVWFKSGIVSYSDEVKIKELKVQQKTINNFSAVSSACALEMAEGAQKKFDADVAISLTGYAGPTGENIGLVYMAVKVKFSKAVVFEHCIKRKDRIAVRDNACVLSLLHTLAEIGKI